MSSKGARNPVDCSSSFPKKGDIYDNLTTDGYATADDRPIFRASSETWLLESTYQAQLWSGKELSVRDLTLAMKQLNDFDVPLALQSSKSKAESSRVAP